MKMFYKLFFGFFFSLILLVKIFSDPNSIKDQQKPAEKSLDVQKQHQTLRPKKEHFEVIEITLDSFYRYEVLNFMAKSNNYTSTPPKEFTKKLIDQAAKMYPNSLNLKQNFVSAGIDYYFQKYPYLYEVTIKELDFGKRDNNTFQLSINLFRNFDDSEVRAILSEELKFFAKQSTAQVIDGFAKIDNETYMKFDGVNSLYYVRDLDKVINAKEYTGFKIEKSPQGQTLNPIFESIIFEKNSQDFFRCIGKTNLPDNFSLSISLFKLGKYEKGLKCEVKNNGLVSEWFKLEDLLVNTYDFEITSPMACIQPKCIQTIIGERGQNLKGPNVEVSTFGMCNSIRFKGKIVVKLIE